MNQHSAMRLMLALLVVSLNMAACAESDTTKLVTEETPVVSLSGAVAVEIGKSIALSATTDKGKDSAYTWASSKTDVADVDESGNVTGMAEGEATITATGADTKASGSWGVFVFKKGEDPVTPEKTPMVEIKGNFGVMVGDTLALTASTNDGKDTGYTWAPGDGEVATVDESGVVTGVKVGEIVITATGKDTGAMAKHGVVVTPRPEKAPDIPLAESWAGSGHADATAEACSTSIFKASIFLAMRTSASPSFWAVRSEVRSRSMVSASA